ncbi:polymorphic toxin-type HINT domain-containing protein [Streptomyces acidiscabies]|uniref:Polymorphic toxin-type HINT domain-containing protein n=4 Tax=Streptomyces acidiscabies TaxID=42234 RepID=A0ABU4M897_9ACTN|nr:polymorphic toxin-type HINT domain-containing protein [Streptomyces acidiscabies]MDX3023971.1 polymorphic toxin-type HINT domain-containing protein [Streptomyces acidiscabies]MDX3793799.1 polymorphic toxin-type HINT domain-containing protein [Streptomyces acidiscabies]GAV42219.1 endo-1,4-beta-xylanase A precursor [Streptomyces acidiscabies]
MATVLLLSSVLTVTSLNSEAWSVPAPGMTRAIELPKLPETDPLDGDEEADKNLTTAPEVPVDPYVPTAVTPWTEDSGTATIKADTAPGTTVPVEDLPIAVGVPEGGDPATLAGAWKVDLASPATSQDAGVSGLIMRVTPPATADPAAQVALAVDTTAFADLYGPQAAERFGLTLLPDCVLDAPGTGDCAPEDGVTTMSGTAEAQPERLSSEVEEVPAADAPARITAAKKETTRTILTGSVPVAELLAGAETSTTTGASIRTAGSASGSGSASASADSAGATAAYSSRALAGTAGAAVTYGSAAAAETAGAAARDTSATASRTAGKATPAAGKATTVAGKATPATTPRTTSTTTPATTVLPAVDAAGPRVVGALDTGSSTSGDFSATPLLSSGSWSAGSSSGAFTYGYQLQVPESAGGLTPKVSFGYSSQTVDGRTSATNNQASWIGDGWDYAPGSITRSYATCREDSKKAGSNNKTHRTSDLCWGSDNATLSLGGTTTELVWADGKWTTANGDGAVVQQIRDESTGNGAYKGEYWIVTTRDGTKYHFGKHKLPGWSSGKPVTDSVLTVPVYGNHSGEDCYQSEWKNSACTQGWRWNLDYVEDVHGNAMSLWWQKEDNYYARNFNFKAPVKYDRGSWLDHIDYGQRKDADGSVLDTPATSRVTFSVAERCLPKDGVCSDANFADKDPGKYRIWYDTPADLRCQSKKMCWNAGPSFWTRKRLTAVTTETQRVAGSTARQTVDKYTLAHDFPVLKTGPNTALWLESVQRTGYERGGASTTLNAVRFESNAEDMPNRVKKDKRPSFSRLRIGRVINEYGGETVVSYKNPTGECATGTGLPGKADTAELKGNTRLCYPSYWHPDPEVEDIDWFHKYVVDTIEELPNVPGAFSTQTAYQYKNAGWKLAEAEFTKKATRTYSQFAGFEQTTVITGSDQPSMGSKRSKAVTRFFRGMGDDVPVKDITGAEIAKDREPFAGRIAEELTYSEAGDADTDWLSRSVTVPEATVLATRARDDGLTPLRAWRVTEPEEMAYTRSSGTGDDKRTERVVKSTTTYEPTYGLPTQVESLGDTGKTGDESCTRLEYLHQTGKNLIGLSKQVLVSPTTCAAADFADLSTLSGATRTAYDGQAYGAALLAGTQGEASQTWSLKGDGSGFQPNGRSEFDATGRVVKQTDPDGNSGTIAYDPPTGQVFKVTETNAAGHTQIQELEPGRGTSLKTTDANGHASEAKYDALGRLVEAWGAGRTPSASAVPDFKAVYTIPEYDANRENRRPPYVTTYARGHENRVETSVTLYDGLGRERQTQEEADGGGHLITDTLYNTSGEIWQTNNAYFTLDAKFGELFSPLADTVVPNITLYTYDGLGRVLAETPVLKVKDAQTGEATSKPVEERATRYEYGQDWSKVINPAGTSSYQVFTDALGRTSRLDTFNPQAPNGFTSTRYTYDRHGRLTKAVNSAQPNSPWSWTYDNRGRQVTATDPDTGTTRTEYDHRDRTLKTVTQRATVWNGYDTLSRPTEQRLNDDKGTLLASFDYDKAPGGKGMPYAATRYTGGEAYTQKVDGYTKDYQPTSTTLTLPQSLKDAWGLDTTYKYGYTYTDTGSLQEATLPKAGRFDAENLVVRYNENGKPLSISGKDWYGAETVYDVHGQVLRSTLGAQPYRVWTSALYDEASGELTEQSVHREGKADTAVVPGNLVSRRTYGYDPSGNVTSIRENAEGKAAERQCFTYDPLGQLKTAWTSGDLLSCVGPKKSDGSLNVSAGADSSGYWQEYEYDLVGNRTKLTEKNLAGSAELDAVTSYTYGKTDGSQPHTLTKVSKKYRAAAGGPEVTAEAERLYELTGETKSITSVQNGDKQELAWTYDGKVERITGAGTRGRTPYVGLADKCLDLKSGVTTAGQPIQLYSCNGTPAQRWSFAVAAGQADPNRGTFRIYDDWCAQPAGSAAGSAVQLQKCVTGASAQEVKRTTAGQLVHVASGLCFAVKDASSANSALIVLAACDAARAEQQWAAQNDTRYVYGPDGSQLLAVKGKQATLFLGDTEVTVAAGGALVNSQRTYSAPGGSVMRYAQGSSTEYLVALAGDHQGSTYVEVGLDGSMPVRVRKQDPFGNQRGAGTVGVDFQSNKGFLGADRDDASGFQPLGARLYDPVVGRFLSADPVLDLNDVLQSNGYSYAHNNPVTMSDPTGLSISLTASERAAALAGAGLSPAQVAQAQAMMGKSLTSVILAVAWETLKDFIGINDAMACFGGDMWSCAGLIVDAIPWTKFGKIPSVLKAVKRTINAIESFKAAKKAAELVLKAAKAAETAALNAKKAAIEKAKREAAQRAKKKAAEQAKRTADAAAARTKKTGNPVQKQAQAKAAPKVSTAKSAGGGSGKSGGSKPGGNSGGSSRSGGGSSGGGGSGKAEGGSCSISNSFVPGTKVLMADGSTKPIEKVKAGDKVIATDPESGETQAQTVTAEIKGKGLKHLVKVTIDTDGNKGTKTASITTTDGHPFWVPELRKWVDATDLQAGQWLRTGAGTLVQVSAVERWTNSGVTVHNLTIGDVHTYYVSADVTPVLVHNCGSSTEHTRMYVAGRPGVDDSPQDPLPESAVIHRGGSLQDGSHAYVVMPGGSVRAFHQDSAFDVQIWAGHTSLSGGAPVIMAGEFTVSNGSIIEFTNFSGHYRPGGSGMEAVARDALGRSGFNLSGAIWNPWNFE